MHNNKTNAAVTEGQTTLLDRFARPTVVRTLGRRHLTMIVQPGIVFA